MRNQDLPGIEEVVDLLGLKRDPKAGRGDVSFMVECPFCGGRGGRRSYKMNINTEKNAYHCYKCGDERGTGVLDLYGRVRMGVRHIKGASGNGKEIMKSLMADLGRDPASLSKAPVQSKTERKTVKEVQIAIDANLDKAFTFILKYPHFQLSQEHRQNLIRRGLDDATIDRNGYATMPQQPSWLNEHSEVEKWYQEEHLEAEKNKYRRTKTMPKSQFLAGLLLAEEMVQAGISLLGVPGAFMVKTHWCFLYEPGMLIPTRNPKGQVVGLQTRLDGKTNLRYVTKSASRLPSAVSSDISRAHFPLGNAKPGKNVRAICTEGPLKADIISFLYPNASYIVALQGVSNTKALSRVFREMKMAGISRVFNGFDIDKCTNTNVRKQSGVIAGKAKAAGLRMTQLCWDEEYATSLWQELHALCTQNNISYGAASNPNVFIQLASMADALTDANVPYCMEEKDGEMVHHYWRDATKGLDDFLLYKKQHV